ncbi:MAG: substrate-binding domain-containing protein [Anaerolineales bacterium]
MTNTPFLNRILFGFYVFVTLAVGVAALIWPTFRSMAYAPLRDLLFPNVFLPSEASTPVTLSVAAPAALEGWVKDNVDEFTAQNPFIKVEVTQLNGADANVQLNTLTGQADVWIAESDFARAAAASIPYEKQGNSIAQDTFLWVAVKAQPALSGSLSWKTVAQAAGSNPSFKIAMPPANSIVGMAACWTAAAEYHNTGNPTEAQVNDPAFRKWLTTLLQAAPNRSRSPRDQLATRPPQANAGLILNSDWSQLAQDVFITQPPASNVAFNYPYYVRSAWQNLQPDEIQTHKDAAVKFRNFLLGSSAQSKLAAYGLQPADAQLAGQLPAMDESMIRALQFCWQ